MKITAERARVEALAVLAAEFDSRDPGIGPESLYMLAMKNILTRRVNELFQFCGDFDRAMWMLEHETLVETEINRMQVLEAILARLNSAVWQLEVVSADRDEVHGR